MGTRPPDQGHQPGDRSSRIYVLILLAIILAAIAGFISFKPRPSQVPANRSLHQ